MRRGDFFIKCLLGFILVVAVVSLAIRIPAEKPSAYPLVQNLFYDAEKVAPHTYKRMQHKGVRRVGIVSIDAHYLKGRNEVRVSCEVSPGITYTATLKRSKNDEYIKFPSDSESWIGEIEGHPDCNIALTIDHERHIVIGEIRTLKTLYEIRSVSKADENLSSAHGLHALAEWNLTEERGIDNCGQSPPITDLLKDKADATEVIVPAGKEKE